MENKPEDDVERDSATATSRDTGGDSGSTGGDSESTTGTGTSETFVGRTAGQDDGDIGESGAEARGAEQSRGPQEQ